MKVKDLPIDDRPREKLLLRGAQNLSDSELIAILLRTGSKNNSVIQLANKLLQESNNLSNLSTKSISYLKELNGIGNDKAATLLAAFEISKRILFQTKLKSNKIISSPSDVAEIFIPLLGNELKEKFIVVCLSSSNKIIRYDEVSVGNLNSSIVHPREIFKVAIENSANSIILIHNHPSGNTEPSSEDITITKKLIEGSKIFDIPIYDHIIIAENTYTSFVERRLI